MSGMRMGALAVAGLGLALLGWAIVARMVADAAVEAGGRKREKAPAPVELAPISRGSIAEHLQVAGSLEASAVVTLAARIEGRLLALGVDVGDVVERGAEIARLDDRRFRQAVAEAEAALGVARARLAQAESQVGLARREAERAATLVARGVGAEAASDRAEAERLAAEAAVQVAAAEVEEAATALAGAQLDLDDCTIRAEWEEGDQQRVVGARFVDVGEHLRADQALVSMIDLQPLTAEIQVTEQVHGRLHAGQLAELRCDAWPGEGFPATVSRLAPAFNPDSRQARIELTVPNGDGRLKPGMFVRASLELAHLDDVVLVPEEALISRRGQAAVFVLDEGASTVRLVKVTIGLRDAGLIQVTGEGLAGRVVVLGHQLLGHGSAVVIPGPAGAAAVTP
jgi:RND family efflux transporter MFP subunit